MKCIGPTLYKQIRLYTKIIKYELSQKEHIFWLTFYTMSNDKFYQKLWKCPKNIIVLMLIRSVNRVRLQVRTYCKYHGTLPMYHGTLTKMIVPPSPNDLMDWSGRRMETDGLLFWCIWCVWSILERETIQGARRSYETKLRDVKMSEENWKLTLHRNKE